MKIWLQRTLGTCLAKSPCQQRVRTCESRPAFSFSILWQKVISCNYTLILIADRVSGFTGYPSGWNPFLQRSTNYPDLSGWDRDSRHRFWRSHSEHKQQRHLMFLTGPNDFVLGEKTVPPPPQYVFRMRYGEQSHIRKKGSFNFCRDCRPLPYIFVKNSVELV